METPDNPFASPSAQGITIVDRLGFTWRQLLVLSLLGGLMGALTYVLYATIVWPISAACICPWSHILQYPHHLLPFDRYFFMRLCFCGLLSGLLIGLFAHAIQGLPRRRAVVRVASRVIPFATLIAYYLPYSSRRSLIPLDPTPYFVLVFMSVVAIVFALMVGAATLTLIYRKASVALQDEES